MEQKPLFYNTISSVISFPVISLFRKENSHWKKNGAWSVPSCELSPFRVAHMANRPSPKLSGGGTMWNDRFSVPLM